MTAPVYSYLWAIPLAAVVFYLTLRMLLWVVSRHDNTDVGYLRSTPTAEWNTEEALEEQRRMLESKNVGNVDKAWDNYPLVETRKEKYRLWRN